MARSLKNEGGEGHNSGGRIDGEALRRYVSRAEAIMRSQKGLGDDLKEVCAEADEAGVASKKEIRRLARERFIEPEILSSQLERMAVLRATLGGLVETPLGEAALAGVRAEVRVLPKRPRGRPRSKVADAMQRGQEFLGTSPYRAPQPENELA